MLRSDFVHYVYAAELIELAREDHKHNKVLKYKKFGNLLHECLGVVSRCCPSVDDESTSSTQEPSNGTDLTGSSTDTDRTNSDVANGHSSTDDTDATWKETAEINHTPVKITTESNATPMKKSISDKARELRNSVTKVNNFKTSVSNCCLSGEKCTGYMNLYV
jgi:hypothetical protein